MPLRPNDPSNATWMPALAAEWPELAAAIPQHPALDNRPPRLVAIPMLPPPVTLQENAALASLYAQWAPTVISLLTRIAQVTAWDAGLGPDFGPIKPVSIIPFHGGSQEVGWSVESKMIMQWGNAGVIIAGRLVVTLRLREDAVPFQIAVASQSGTTAVEPTLPALKMALVQAFLDGPITERTGWY